jgi:hypothetical protein
VGLVDDGRRRKSGLPPLPGTYALVPRFSERAENVVGRLGVLSAQASVYVYADTALGPGGCAGTRSGTRQGGAGGDFCQVLAVNRRCDDNVTQHIEEIV